MRQAWTSWGREMSLRKQGTSSTSLTRESRGLSGEKVLVSVRVRVVDRMIEKEGKKVTLFVLLLRDVVEVAPDEPQLRLLPLERRVPRQSRHDAELAHDGDRTGLAGRRPVARLVTLSAANRIGRTRPFAQHGRSRRVEVLLGRRVRRPRPALLLRLKVSEPFAPEGRGIVLHGWTRSSSHPLLECLESNICLGLLPDSLSSAPDLASKVADQAEERDAADDSKGSDDLAVRHRRRPDLGHHGGITRDREGVDGNGGDGSAAVVPSAEQVLCSNGERVAGNEVGSRRRGNEGSCGAQGTDQDDMTHQPSISAMEEQTARRAGAGWEEGGLTHAGRRVRSDGDQESELRGWPI